MNNAFLIKEITVIDPDTKGDVRISVYKHSNGGIFAIDSSFIEDSITTDEFDRVIIPDPFGDVNDSTECVVLFE